MDTTHKSKEEVLNNLEELKETIEWASGGRISDPDYHRALKLIEESIRYVNNQKD
jgi:hypothetical protein